MDQEKHLSSDITKFIKSCKEKQQQLHLACEREEKKLKEEYSDQQATLSKRHAKEAEKLQHTLVLRRKALHRKLEHELQIELKLYKRYVGLRTQSTGRILNQPIPRITDSERSLNTTVPHGDDDNLTTPTENHRENNLTSNNWLKRKIRKDGGDSSYCDSYTESDLKVTLTRLRDEMDERIKFADDEARMATAHLDREFMKNKQELKRNYLEALAEFKQRRLSSLGQMKKCEVKGYFDIHRQWMISDHVLELRERQKNSQDTLKRLAVAQAIERETACRLARTMMKGQKQVADVLYTIRPKSKLANQSVPLRNSCEYSTEREGDEDRLIDQLFSRTQEEQLTGGVHVIRSGNDPSQSITSPIGTSSSEHRVQSSGSQQTVYERNHGVDESNVSAGHTKRSNPKTVRGKLQQKYGLHHSKSLQSITSALETCDHLHRSLMDNLSKQQIDQWVDVLEQETSITDALMKAHTEQKKSLIEQEQAALKRAQLEHEHRAAHLAVVLEATEKFTEKTFLEEQQRFHESRYKKQISSNNTLQAQPSSDFLAEYASTAASEIFNNAQLQIPSIASIDQVQSFHATDDPSTDGSMLGQPARSHVVICHEAEAR